MSAHRNRPGNTLRTPLALASMGVLALMLALLLPAAPAPAQVLAQEMAQGPPPWQSPPPKDDAYRPPGRDDGYRPPGAPPGPGRDDGYRPPAQAPYYPPGADPKNLPGEPYPGPYANNGPYGYEAPKS